MRADAPNRPTRRWAWAAAMLLVAALLLWGLWPRPLAPYSIERLSTYQQGTLLRRAWSLPVARLYGPRGFAFQSNPSVCGPASIANVLRSVRRPQPPDMLSGSGVTTWFGILPGGMTLDQEAALLQRRTEQRVAIMRDLSLGAFRAEMRRSNDPRRRIIVNFSRLPLFGRGHGHFSPVLGYLAAEDLVFVGDVNADFKPWLVRTARLFAAVNTIDPATAKKRGVLEVAAQ